MNNVRKPLVFFHRLFRNFLCCFKLGRNYLYPPEKLARQFGPSDAEYAWRVFLNHLKDLKEHGFVDSAKVLEIGPGRNLGTSLLWSCYLNRRNSRELEVVCWDVYRNANPETPNFWNEIAADLLVTSTTASDVLEPDDLSELLSGLTEIVRGKAVEIRYLVCPIEELVQSIDKFSLVYSQAAIEHVWCIQQFWKDVIGITSPGGWHSHRIDLVDHGRRYSNPIEFLQWSDWAYWVTQRFVPGATNRWRSRDYELALVNLGCVIRLFRREFTVLDIPPRNRLNQKFANLPIEELRTTAINVVATKKLPNGTC